MNDAAMVDGDVIKTIIKMTVFCVKLEDLLMFFHLLLFMIVG